MPQQERDNGCCRNCICGRKEQADPVVRVTNEQVPETCGKYSYSCNKEEKLLDSAGAIMELEKWSSYY